MRVHLCGVRGSTPAPGPDFVRYGGNTSCVAIARDGADPTLLLDAGTGLASVSRSLTGQPYRGHILLTHLHWDHVQGLPFFRAGDRDDATVHLMLPAQDGEAPDRPGSAAALLARAVSPPHFPIGPDGLLGQWSFDALDAGRFTVAGCTVTAVQVPQGRTHVRLPNRVRRAEPGVPARPPSGGRRGTRPGTGEWRGRALPRRDV